MATYLPGVTDYIPHIQPFRPDLNFYQGVLERKESQYQEGYNRLSSVYGTMLNSPMLRGVNNERRDQFFKNAEGNLKKISELDLSLEENVDAAYQVFQPLIDDKNIMKDMAWTKHYQNEISKAEGFRNCIDEAKCGGKWWEGGVRALNYMAEDFSLSDDNTAMGMENARFTPYVNVMEKAMKSAKDMGFDVTKSFTDGRYIHTYKNGQLLTMPLANYFMGTIGKDPKVMETYQIQAYLDRKDFMKVHAEEYGGEDGAENFYLQDGLQKLEKLNQENKSNNASTKNDLTIKKNYTEEKIKNQQGDPSALVLALQNLDDQLEKSDSFEDHVKTTGDLIDKSTLLGADKKTLRWRIDNAVASSLLQNELGNAALTYSALNSSEKIEADPYGVSAQNHMFRISELKVASDLRKGEVWFKDQLDAEKEKAAAENGYKGGLDEQGQPIDVPGSDAYKPMKAEYEEKIKKQGDLVSNSMDDLLQKIYVEYHGLATSPESTDAEKKHAQQFLDKTFGKHGLLKAGSYDLKWDSLTSNPEYTKSMRVLYTEATSEIKNSKDVYDLDFLDKIHTGIQDVQDGYKLLGKYFDWDATNNKHILAYVNKEADSESWTPERKENFNMMIKPDGKFIGPIAFADKYLAMHPTEDKYDAYEVYDDMFAAYKDMYNTPSLGKTSETTVVPWLGSNAVTGSKGGGQYSQARLFQVDPTLGWKSPSVQGLLSTIPDVTSGDPSVKFSQGDITTKDDYTSATSDDTAKNIYLAYVNDLKYREWDPKSKTYKTWKGDNPKKPSGQVIYQNTAVEDPDMTAVKIIPSRDWIDAHAGTEKKPGLTWGMQENIAKNGVVVYMPRNTSNNYFKQSMDVDMWDVLLNHGEPQTKSFPGNGSYTVKKDLSTGAYQVEGYAWGYNDNGKKEKVSVSGHYQSNVGSGNLIGGLDEYFKKIGEENNKITKALWDEQWKNLKK